MSEIPADRPYHHGDLRRQLVDTALLMLAEQQGWQFTLRELARRIGVSHAAPYKHFADKRALLAALALHGFEQLNQALAQAQPPQALPVLAALEAAADAYLRFGLAHPGLYRLMFSAEAGEAAALHRSPPMQHTFGVLTALLEHGQALGVFRRRPVPAQAAACWAHIHGMTLLAIEGLLLPERVGLDPHRAALHALLEGIAGREGNPVNESGDAAGVASGDGECG